MSFTMLEYFFDSVLNFPVPDGLSGQQAVDMIQKKLETLGAEKTGNFAVDSETYQSQPRMYTDFNHAYTVLLALLVVML